MSPEEHLRLALAGLGYGDDPETQKTPERLAAFLRERVQGERPALSTFPAQNSGPVIMRDMPFHALCAHHLLPFFGTATIAYQPHNKVGGFSGIARLLTYHCLGPQLQERVAEALADSLVETLSPRGVIVRLTARQLCMEMRGADLFGNIDVVAQRGDTDLLLPLL